MVIATPPPFVSDDSRREIEQNIYQKTILFNSFFGKI